MDELIKLKRADVAGFLADNAEGISDDERRAVVAMRHPGDTVDIAVHCGWLRVVMVDTFEVSVTGGPRNVAVDAVSAIEAVRAVMPDAEARAGWFFSHNHHAGGYPVFANEYTGAKASAFRGVS